MGGAAFSQALALGQPTLNTPRMSPDTYSRLKNLCLKKLQDYLPEATVSPLIEAPEKTDYGDIDFFIALDQRVDFIDLANHLGAAGVICHDNKKATFGVQKDGNVTDRSCVLYKHMPNDTLRKTGPSATITTEEYAQVDVEIIPPELSAWHSFYSSYSDMAGLLGHIITQLGFTVSDRGLWLRMRELDFSKTVSYVNVADRDGTILLSTDPGKVIEFLGCSVDQYQSGFNTLDELYSWLGSCRLLSVEALKSKRDNAHERNREQKRSVYSGFFNQWLPAHMDMHCEKDEQDRKDTVLHLRQRFLEEAVDFFSKRTEYESKRDALVRAINNALAAHLLKPIIAEHSGRQDKHLNEILKAFRRHVGFDKYSHPQVLEKPHADTDSELQHFLNDDQTALRDQEMTSEWVKVHWEEIRGLARQRVKVAFAG